VLALRVKPAQRAFVGAITNLLADAEQCTGCEPMAILLGDRAIGYYQIERRASGVAGYDFDVPARGLRCFFIDADQQGRGFGRRALELLLVDLVTRDPLSRLLVLAVDEPNRAALALYGAAGFVEGQPRYHGGSSVPQRVLWRSLP
jgi:GNAT superfamily N-acetyltransferase